MIQLEVAEQLKQLNQLLNPTAPKITRVNLNLFEHVWLSITSRAKVPREVEPEPLKLCSILIDKLWKTIRELINDRRTHRKVKEALSKLLKEISECPHTDNIIDSVGAIKNYVEILSLKVYETLNCNKICEKEKNKACINSCNSAIERIIKVINQMGFLLDTCYDKNKFNKLYQRVKELLECQADTALVIISVIATLTMMETLGLHGGRWLYILAAQKLGLPLHPWLGDVVAILYVANAVNAFKKDATIEVTFNTIGELVKFILECR